MAIDVHAHCVPVGVIDELRSDAGRRYDVTIHEKNGRLTAVVAGRTTVGPIERALMNVPARLQAMDTAGVRIQVLSSWMGLTAYGLAPAPGARYARMFNEQLADTVALHPERFLAVCTVPLQDPALAATELAHAVTSLGMIGVEIGTTVNGMELDDPALEPFWRAAQELRCLVVIHPHVPLAGRSLAGYGLYNLVGNPAETTIAASRLIFGGVMERHPDLQLCLVHGGGFAPFQVDRWDRAVRAGVRGAGQNLNRLPSEWLAQMYLDTVLHGPRSIGLLLDRVGSDHVVLGSDYPFEMGDPEPVATVAAVPGLSESARQLVLHGNLERLVAALRS